MFEQAKKKREILESYRKVFSSPEGKLILEDLIKSTKFFETIYHEDHSIMAFDEGQRALVLRIISMVRLKPKDIDKMFDELIFD
jgi:hypothetical protein